jgi:hypothetical protein
VLLTRARVLLTVVVAAACAGCGGSHHVDGSAPAKLGKLKAARPKKISALEETRRARKRRTDERRRLSFGVLWREPVDGSKPRLVSSCY